MSNDSGLVARPGLSIRYINGTRDINESRQSYKMQKGVTFIFKFIYMYEAEINAYLCKETKLVLAHCNHSASWMLVFEDTIKNFFLKNMIKCDPPVLKFLQIRYVRGRIKNACE